MQIAINNIIGMLRGCEPHVRASIAELLAFDVENAQANASVQMGLWNGRRTLLRDDNSFEAGFTNMIMRHLAEMRVPVTLHDFRPKVSEVDLGIDVANCLNGIVLRDYQVDAVLEGLRQLRGVLWIATGGGKTEIAAAFCKILGVPALFLTHKIDLVEQTKKRFEQRIGCKVGVIAEGEFTPSLITVASVQTIMANWEIWWRVEGHGRKLAGDPLVPIAKTIRAKNQLDAIASARGSGMEIIEKLEVARDNRVKIDNFLAGIELLIVDEAHRVSGDSFFKIAGACLNATHRFMLTATPLMKESREDNLKLIAAGGDIICHVSIKRLIELGVLTQPHFTWYEVPGTTGLTMRQPYPKAYNAGIVHHQVRNALVIKAAQDLIPHRPVVLVWREEHGELLAEMARAKGLRVLWVSGKTGGSKKAKVRRDALDALRDKQIDVLIASTIFDEGLDESCIGAIIMAGGNKSEISTYQRTGRSGRLKTDGRAQESFIVDFIDTGNNTLRDHSELRFKNVSEEEGWIVDKVIPWDERTRPALLAGLPKPKPVMSIPAGSIPGFGSYQPAGV